MNLSKLFIIFLIATVLLSAFGVLPVRAQPGASLYLSPGSGTFYVGSTFNLSVFVNTGGKSINALKVDLKFDPRKLQVASPTAGKSFISVWVAQPGYSNFKGTVSFQGGVPSPGVDLSAGLVSTITFRAIAPGQTTISLEDSSQVLLNDGQGTNILTSLSKGVYYLAIPPPEGPPLFSLTHPDQNKWYKNNNPTFSWQRESGVGTFSYSLDNDFQGTPDNIAEGEHTSISYSNLEDGFWYFHIKGQKAGVWGGVSHYLVQVDTTPPADFSLEFEPPLYSPHILSQEPIVFFITTDALSGLDHFEFKSIALSKSAEEKETGFFIEVSSPYQVPVLESGEYLVVVRAHDKAMNWQEVSKQIEVVTGAHLFFLSKGGINLAGLFISWGRLIACLIFLFFLISGFIFYWFKKSRQKLAQERKVLVQAKEKATASKQALENKFNNYLKKE